MSKNFNPKDYERDLKNWSGWGFLRREALARDEYMCRNCGSGRGPLHVHHKYYPEEGVEYTKLEHVETLCNLCHKAAHGKLGGFEKLIYSLSMTRD